MNYTVMSRLNEDEQVCVCWKTARGELNFLWIQHFIVSRNSSYLLLTVSIVTFLSQETLHPSTPLNLIGNIN